MKRIQIVQEDTLPEDIALKIVSSLEVSDVCSLGSCSKFWREINGSEYLWKTFCLERWPGIILDDEQSDETHDPDQQKESTFKGWRGLYLKKHNEMVQKATCLAKFLSSPPIQVNDYLKAIEGMKLTEFGFKDVQIIFLKPNIDVLLNLVGLHYCIKELGVEEDCISQALSSCKIQDREVYINWWMRGNWLHRFRPPDFPNTRCITLGDLPTTGEGGQMLGLLEEGIVGPITRVEVCLYDALIIPTPPCTRIICNQCRKPGSRRKYYY